MNTYKWKSPTQPYPSFNQIKTVNNVKVYKYLYALVILSIIFIISNFY